ncbi:hypothetical protein D3C72_1819970 [compost metagenome]
MGLDRRIINGMDRVEKMIGVDLVLEHQSVQRGAEVPVIALLQGTGGFEIEPRHVHHILGDAAVDLREEIAFARIEGVVEVEHPVGDVAEAAQGRGRHVVHGHPILRHNPKSFT